jgi:acyl-CoA thioesterase
MVKKAVDMKEFLEKAKKDPYANFLGIRIDEAKRGYAVCSVVVREEMLNFNGLLHGGFVFSLADFAFSVASNSDHMPSFALDISGSFLKTAAVGDNVIAEARLIHGTRRTGLYRMEVFKNRELIATFNGTVFRLTTKPS